MNQSRCWSLDLDVTFVPARLGCLLVVLDNSVVACWRNSQLGVTLFCGPPGLRVGLLGVPRTVCCDP
jgi:hypothetical protein